MPFQPYRTIPREYNPKLREVSCVSMLPLGFPKYSPFLIPIIPMGLSSYGQFIAATIFPTSPGSAVSFTSSTTSGMTLPSPTDITVGNAGDYLIITTASWDHTGGGAPHLARQWVNVNGTAVPNSAVEARIDNNTTNMLPLTNQWLLTNLSAGDVIQVWWATSDTTSYSLYPTNQAAVTTAPIVGSWTINSPAVPVFSSVVLQLS